MSKKRFWTLTGIAIFLMILFIVWTILVANHKFDGLDNSVVNSIVDMRGEKNGPFYWIVRLTTEFGFVYIIVAIIILVLILHKANLKSILLGVGAGSAYITNMVVKLIVKRERPLEEFRWMAESSYSYPSSHTMCTTFLYGFLIYIVQTSNIKKEYKWIFTAICAIIIPWVGFTRIVLSVHFFSDVCGGFIFGLFVLDVIILAYEFFHSKGYDGFYNMIKNRKTAK